MHGQVGLFASGLERCDLHRKRRQEKVVKALRIARSNNICPKIRQDSTKNALMKYLNLRLPVSQLSAITPKHGG
jgi:hypothetical protein